MSTAWSVGASKADSVVRPCAQQAERERRVLWAFLLKYLEFKGSSINVDAWSGGGARRASSAKKNSSSMKYVAGGGGLMV